MPESNLEVNVTLGETAWLAADKRWRVPVQLSFTNRGDKLFELDKQTACEGGRLRNNVFTVLVDGVEARYLGMMKKRAHPGPDGFFKLAAGEAHTVEVDLGADYAFPKKGGELEIAFDHYNHFSQDAVQLTSEPVHGRL